MARNKTQLALRFFVIIIAGALSALIVQQFINHQKEEQQAPTNNQIQTENPSNTSTPLAFDKNRYSLDTPDSIWAVINKQRPLPSSYIPSQLTGVGGANLQVEAARALEQLLKASAGEQIQLRTISGYRSYADQEKVYNSYVQKDGQAAADTYSARPGHSEHQTGLAVDLGNGSGQCDLEICFANTNGGKWLADHAHTYGFTIRYSNDKTAITGYQYEPWHIRYIGVDLANELRNKNQTMEEFFNLPAAPSY